MQVLKVAVSQLNKVFVCSWSLLIMRETREKEEEEKDGIQNMYDG